MFSPFEASLCIAEGDRSGECTQPSRARGGEALRARITRRTPYNTSYGGAAGGLRVADATMQRAPVQRAPMQRAPMQRAPMQPALKRLALCATCHARRCKRTSRTKQGHRMHLESTGPLRGFGSIYICLATWFLRATRPTHGRRRAQRHRARNRRERTAVEHCDPEWVSPLPE